MIERFELIRKYKIPNILRYDFDYSKQGYEMFTELTFSTLLEHMKLVKISNLVLFNR